MRTFHLSGWILLLLTGIGRSAEPVSFRSEVAPILLDQCVACHSAKNAEGGYRVDSYDELIKAGDSGESPVARDTKEVSELLRRVTCEDESLRMPAESEPLTDEQIRILGDWIQAGAPFDGERSSDPLSLVIPAPRHVDPPESYRSPLPITAICFSPDGGQLIVGGYHELTLWDVNDARLVRRITNVGQRVFSICLDAEGETIAVGCGEPGRSGELRLIDFTSGEVKGVIARTDDAVLDAAFRPGSHQIAVASADRLIRIFDVQSLELLRTIASHADWVNAVSFSDDGSRLVSASRDKTAKVFDAESGDLLASYLGHGAAVRGVSILADGKQVVSAGDDRQLHRWQIEGAKRVAQVNLDAEAFKLVRGSDFVLVPCTDKRLRRLNLADNKISQQYSGHSDWVLSTALDRGATKIAGGSFDGEVRIWKLADGGLSQSWLAKP